MKSNSLAWIFALSVCHILYPEALSAFQVGERSNSLQKSKSKNIELSQQALGAFEVGESSNSPQNFKSKNINEAYLRDSIAIRLQHSPPREITQISRPQEISQISTPVERPRAIPLQVKPEIPISSDGIWSNMRSKMLSWKEKIPTLEEFTGQIHSILGISGEEIDPSKIIPQYDKNKLQSWVNHIYDKENTGRWLLGELTGVPQRSIFYKSNKTLIQLLEKFELERTNMDFRNLENFELERAKMNFKIISQARTDYVTKILKDIANMRGESNVELARLADCAFALAQITVQNVKGKGEKEIHLRGEIKLLILNLWQKDEPTIFKLWQKDKYIPNLSNRRVNSLFQTFSELLNSEL